MHHLLRRCSLAGLPLLMASAALASGLPAVGLEEVVVRSQRIKLIGAVESASQGTVLADQLENRPTLRPGEVLEVVPGLVVTQHSGDGKANQYFLRGFNLDHGTDFATTLDGIPVNLPTHAHGQGYTDLNPLIPELVDTVHYRKGPYFADVGQLLGRRCGGRALSAPRGPALRDAVGGRERLRPRGRRGLAAGGHR